MNMKKELKKNNSEYIYQLLIAEKHENELLRARIESMMVENASYTFRQQTRKILTLLKKNKLAVLFFGAAAFVFLILSSMLAQIIIGLFY
jgi:hypothetical protein